jgi:hypothetical protein
MKPGMVLLLLMVLATSYLIGVAIRKRNKRNEALRWDAAKFDARWEVFSEPENGQIEVGVRRVARLGNRFELLDQDIRTRVPCDLPRDDRDTEVRIAKADAKAFADTLNGEEDII